MASISAAVRRIKQDPLAPLGPGVIHRLCAELRHQWRQRELDPATTLTLFVQQVVHGNTPCSEVRHIAAAGFTASAYCQARSRLPLQLCQALLGAAVDAGLQRTRHSSHRWRGHRVLHIDGSTFSMPDTAELRKVFGLPRGQEADCGFPVAHLLVLFSAQTGLLLDAWASPLRTGDLSLVREAHLHLSPGDVLIGDDSFGTYAHLALLLREKLHGLFPVHHLRIVDFKRNRPHTMVSGKNCIAGLPRSRWLESLGKEDQLVEYHKPQQKPLWMSQSEFDELPPSIIVRELRRTVRRPGLGKVTLTIVTTLIDAAAYPAEELVELRLRRWDVETNLRHLKTTMNMDVLRCKSEAGVRKELAIFCLVYNLVRLVMLEAAVRQRAAPSRISFADTLKWMRHARAGAAMPRMMLVPLRPHRFEPRCKKRRAKQYDLMNKPRDVLRNRLKTRGKELS